MRSTVPVGGGRSPLAFGGTMRMSKKTLNGIVAVGLLALLVAVVLPNFMRARHTTTGNPCAIILRQLDGATQEWALENRKTTNDVPTWEDLRPYLPYLLGDGRIPTCYHGGTYTLGRPDKPPACSYPGDTLQ